MADWLCGRLQSDTAGFDFFQKTKIPVLAYYTRDNMPKSMTNVFADILIK